ncbi:hypothetical protein [Natronosalvus vescus]|uniref:hypothetical protein n=1 Tax=Natronosalvus vescus TaxID=2953881 RepID=UPI002090C197|nr:hypothetical protein [Natronosalvus vescus]
MTVTRDALERVPLLCRSLAFILLAVGFVGFLTTDATILDTGSVFTIVFGLGVAAAIVSIYLGILLHDPDA